jgi:FkbM family methyltransferase
MQFITQYTPRLKKMIHRTVRWNPMVERAQQMARMSPILHLEPIDLQVKISPDDVLIDCGANIGAVTSKFARTGARVYAFEPNPLCFSVLSRRFSLTPNVTCLNKGVMDKKCALDLVTQDSHGKWDELDTSPGSTVMMGQPPQGFSSTQVECINLSEFVFSLNQRVRFIKLDIEGAEIAVINGLIDTTAIDRIDFVLAETHERQLPFLREDTEQMKLRISDCGLQDKFRLDWI